MAAAASTFHCASAAGLMHIMWRKFFFTGSRGRVLPFGNSLGLA